MPYITCDECKAVVKVNDDNSILYDFEAWEKQCVHDQKESPFLCPHLQKAFSAAGKKCPRIK